jgi:hypothetical protein
MVISFLTIVHSSSDLVWSSHPPSLRFKGGGEEGESLCVLLLLAIIRLLRLHLRLSSFPSFFFLAWAGVPSREREAGLVVDWIGLSCYRETRGLQCATETSPRREKTGVRRPPLTEKRCLGLLAGNLGLGGGKGRRQAVLRVDAVDAVHGVEVLDTRDLEAGCAALARGDRGVGEEVFPDLERGFVSCVVLWG